ncbi:diguanylate cyclase [compost metagenome]
MLGSGEILRVTASFGVAQGTLDPIGWHALVRAADTAMYAAKSLGRDRVQVATGGRAAR